MAKVCEEQKRQSSLKSFNKAFLLGLVLTITLFWWWMYSPFWTSLCEPFLPSICSWFNFCLTIPSAYKSSPLSQYNQSTKPLCPSITCWKRLCCYSFDRSRKYRKSSSDGGFHKQWKIHHYFAKVGSPVASWWVWYISLRVLTGCIKLVIDGGRYSYFLSNAKVW